MRSNVRYDRSGQEFQPEAMTPATSSVTGLGESRELGSSAGAGSLNPKDLTRFGRAKKVRYITTTVCGPEIAMVRCFSYIRNCFEFVSLWGKTPPSPPPPPPLLLLLLLLAHFFVIWRHSPGI